MNKKIMIGIVSVALVAGAFVLLTSRRSQTSPTPPQTNQETTPAPQTANEVLIENFSFSPSVLTVKAGTKVTWINQDSFIHTIKSGSFNSSDLKQGDKFEFTFNDKGSFDYACGVHPSMTGKIIVE